MPIVSDMTLRGLQCLLYNVARFTVPMLKSICETLDIDRSGKKEDVIERIMTFLMEPKSSGKPLPNKRECLSVVSVCTGCISRDLVILLIYQREPCNMDRHVM